MVSFKMNLAFFVVVVACVAAITEGKEDAKIDVAQNGVSYSEPKSESKTQKNETKINPEPEITTIIAPSTTTTTTTTTTPPPPPPPKTTPTPPKPTPTTPSSNTTTTTVIPTTVIPTTTPSPKPTPTTTPTPTPSPKPTPTPTPTPTPSVSTTTEKPSNTKPWDGTSFLSGMVLAFGLVIVGAVGYRFFYLGRGGAYHTL